MKEVKAFKCEYCGKLYAKNFKHHEKFCSKNPNNKHVCFDCEHLEINKNVIIISDEAGYIEKSFVCSKFQKGIYSYKAEKLRINIDGLERMPISCGGYKFDITKAL